MPEPAETPALAPGAPEPGPSLYAMVKSSSRPVVLRVGSEKKRRYSKPLRGLQRSLAAADRARERLYGALAAGASEYRERARASAGKRRDGMLRDAGRNSARALETVLRKSAKIPRDLARAGGDADAAVRSLKRQAQVLRWLTRG